MESESQSPSLDQAGLMEPVPDAAGLQQTAVPQQGNGGGGGNAGVRGYSSGFGGNEYATARLQLAAVPLPPGNNSRSPRDLTKLRELAAELNRGRSQRGELSTETRIAIVTAVATGLSKTAVAEAFGVAVHTVRNAVDRWEARRSTASRPRSGRPRKLNEAAEQALVLAAQQQPGVKPGDLGIAYNISRSSVRRVMQKHQLLPPANTGAGRGAGAAKRTAAKSAQVPVVATPVVPPISPGPVFDPALMGAPGAMMNGSEHSG